MRRGMQGHVAEPCEPTWHRWRTSGADVWQGHTSPRGCQGGTTWQEGWQVKGARVSGPWLDSWGGNAIALNRPSFYTHAYSFFSSVWDYVPVRFNFFRRRGSTVDVGCDRNKCKRVDRVDPSPRDHHQGTCAKGILSDAFDNLPGDTWMHQERPIFIGRAKQAQGVGCVSQSWVTHGRMMSFSSSSDGSR